jgi:alpha-tubulin suppressor-like RCC1 family protein
MAESGRVFSFGDNFDGQLGLGTAGGSVLTPTPIDTSNLVGQVITQLAAGDYFSLLLTEPALPGDFNLDGAVDGRDFLAWQRNASVGDLADWRASFGTTSLAAAQMAVPEPAVAALAAVAFLCTAPFRAKT